MTDPKPRRPRGVRLTDLDRSRLWVIGHNGQRWETLGPLDPAVSASVVLGSESGTGAPAPRTDPDPAGRSGAPASLDDRGPR